MGIMALHWGVLFNAEKKIRTLTVFITDFDSRIAPYETIDPFVGPIVREVAQEFYNAVGQPSLGYTVVPPEQFNFDPMAVRQAVYDFHCYAAIIVNSGASGLLLDAVAYNKSSYDPTGAVQMIVTTARDQITYSSYIVPQLEDFIDSFLSKFGPVWTEMLMSNASISKDNMLAASSAVNPGIMPKMVDLRPFWPPSATPCVTTGLIYITIISFFSSAFFLPLHKKYLAPVGHPHLRFLHFLIWRWLATVVFFFFVSLAYSMVSIAFQIPFWMPPASPVETAVNASAYGRASFLVYWLVNFVGMVALGLASENVIMLLGQRWTVLWLVFWVATNVSTSLSPIDLAPRFYRWGYAWPLLNIGQATRSIMFDLHSKIGLNLGVLFTWVAINTALFPLCAYIQKCEFARGERIAEHKKGRFVVHSVRHVHPEPREVEKNFSRPGIVVSSPLSREVVY
ncbi:MNNG and nitrosoguanidine resistance protein [Xylariales sp. PMI_506]|nr:MNNG and nitrosoguanidine resistance protein [Xylariales sp. PMI_506]